MSDLLGFHPVALPIGLSIPAADWQQTPTSVQQQFLSLLKRVETLEARLNPNASNSNQPPSTDWPPLRIGEIFGARLYLTYRELLLSPIKKRKSFGARPEEHHRSLRRMRRSFSLT
jgi:hypothetical protein